MRNTKIILSPEERQSKVLKDYFKSINKFSTLTTEEERNLCLKISNGDWNAREKLIKSNLKLVISIAKKYQGYGLSLLDLIEEGNKGLVLGVEHYDINRKTKFSTCASWWIRYSIKKALTDDSRTVRIPISQYNRYKEINEFVNSVTQETQESPTSDEINDKLKIQKEHIDIVLSNLNPTIPFLKDDNPINSKDFSTEKEIEQKSLLDFIERILSKLSKREESVIRRIFGIGCDEMSIKDIASEFGLTYERIRQIKKIALAKIKQRYPNLRKELYND